MKLAVAIGILWAIIMIWIVRRVLKLRYLGKMTPTMKFILAVNATTDIHTLKTCIDVNGYRYNIITRFLAKYILKFGWDVDSKESAIDMVDWLFNEGHNTGFMDDLESLDEKDLKWIYETNFYEESEDEDEEAKQMRKHLNNMKKVLYDYPSQGILAWDLCRVLYVVGGAYQSGYLTYQESIHYCIQACRMLQENYSSWDDMIGSYLIGYDDWCTTISNNSRKEKYEKLKSVPNGLYSIPWDTKLDENDVIRQRII